MKISRVPSPTSALLAFILVLAAILPGGSAGALQAPGKKVKMSLAELQDKIRGGWAGQTIGCTFGGPTEFAYQGTFIQDYQAIPWSDGSIAETFAKSPGLYDDVYMDLTFIDVFDKKGLDARPADFAKAFAEAPYPLWHANQMARYNIRRGLLPPASGDWRNNPHADDIDFQIEADFAGLMSPGLVNASSRICDAVGHIMNYGDGWYGGVYIAAMYSLAFVSGDIRFVVEEALKTIPPQTGFARTMREVIQGYRDNPSDWKATWFRVLRRFGEDIGCPEGVFSSFDIDAKINCAWVVLGLLYGGGDFAKTLEISARGGDDSDCNPASAGGILGTLLGYKNIPVRWTRGLEAIEDKPFPYTTISLREAGRLSALQAAENIRRHGGRVDAKSAEWTVQAPEPVRTEIAFPGYVPVEKRRLGKDLDAQMDWSFEGTGFAFVGEAVSEDGTPRVVKVGLKIDGGPAESWELPTSHLQRNPTPLWKYGLKPGRHDVRIRILNPDGRARLRLESVVIYAESPRAGQR